MNIPVSICSSCAACANVCARQAISMQLDGEGFYRPVIDTSKCVECGACAKVCPWLNSVVNPNSSAEKPRTVAALAKDDSVRMASSSGGIFTVLAKAVLAEGGVVAGVAQMDSGSFAHIVIDNITDLEKLRGSKYVQANPGMMYREVKSLLKGGRKVLFSGTPCQVAALYSVLGKNSFENLWTVDIVCHGTPSVKVWRKYVDELENKEDSRLSHVTFRDKSTGWSGYSLIHSYENGKNTRVGHGSSVYMNLFLSRICQNTSCSDCRYRKLPRIADITLGDFWGISKFHPQMDDNKGTSVVLLNTERGESLFNSISGQIRQCESSVENAIAGNPCIVRSSVEHPMRAEFFAKLDEYSLQELIRKYCPYPSFSRRCYLKIRSILGCIRRKRST